jgi:hypothetical protein
MAPDVPDQTEPDRLRSEDSGRSDLVTGTTRILRHWRLLLGAPLAAAAIAAGIVGLRPDRYLATSTVVIVPPPVETSLSNEVATPAGLQQLATSSYVVDRVAETLRASGDLAPGESAGDFAARLRESGPSANPYLSLILLDVTAADPELARRAANAWAEVLVAEERAIATRGTAFILSEFPKAAEEYESAERESRSLAERHTREMAETRSKAAVSLQTARLQSREQAIVRIDESLDWIRLELARYTAQIEQLTKELAQTPPVVILSRASAGEDPPGTVAGGGGSPSPDVRPATVEEEAINPLHTSLAQQLAQARVSFQAASAQLAGLEAQRATAVAEAGAAREALSRAEMLVSLTTGRQEMERAEQARRLDQSKSRFTFLSGRVGEAGVAVAAGEGTLRVGGLAGPAEPSGGSAPLAAVVAFSGALLAVLVGLWLFEYLGALARAR